MKLTRLALALLLCLFTTPTIASPGTDWLKRRAASFSGVGGCVIARDNQGAIYRNRALIRRFHRATGFPGGRRGWVVDHVISLKRGGCDWISNLAWQTIEDAKEKDRWE